MCSSPAPSRCPTPTSISACCAARSATSSSNRHVPHAGGHARSRGRILDEELDRRYFTPVIEKIYSLTEEYGQHRWDVLTDRGRRVFYVRNWRDNVHELSPVRYLIVAVDGSRYEIRDLDALDAASRAQLERLG